MDYEVYLRTEAFEFLRHRHSDERNRLLKLLHNSVEIRIAVETLVSAIGADGRFRF
jgi:hypothetical protein